VRATLARIGLDPENVHLAAHLVDDLDLDSLDWVDFAIQLEETLSIDLREERFTSIRTVQDIVDRACAALVVVGRAEG
jgi:acyl carrier protein